MAANLLYPPGSSLALEVLTSFVLPAHNQGASYAPIRGHAPWKIFLSTTGSFFVPDAVLRSFNQDLRPCLSNCPHLCIPPNLVHSINTQRHDIFREWCLLKNQHSTFGIRFSVYRLIFREIYIEPTTDPVLNSCKFRL